MVKMILSSALRKKMEELAKDCGCEHDPKVGCPCLIHGFTAAVYELTKVPKDVENKIAEKARKQGQYFYPSTHIFTACEISFENGANFFKSEI